MPILPVPPEASGNRADAVAGSARVGRTSPIPRSTATTRSAGIANAMSSTDTDGSPTSASVVIPTTVPLRSTSAPPELPELIAASVWITSVSVAVDRPTADTMPRVIDGAPSRFRALPIATTSSPGRTAAGPARRATGSPCAPSMRSHARSASSSDGDHAGGAAAPVRVDQRGRRLAVHEVLVGDHVAGGGDDEGGAGGARVRRAGLDAQHRGRHGVDGGDEPGCGRGHRSRGAASAGA